MGRCEARLSQPHCVPCCLHSLWRMGGCVGREVPGPDANFARPLTPLPGSSLVHHTLSSWDPKIARSESPPVVQPTGVPPHPIPSSYRDRRVPEASRALPASTHGCKGTSPHLPPHLPPSAGLSSSGTLSSLCCLTCKHLDAQLSLPLPQHLLRINSRLWVRLQGCHALP